MHEIEMFGFMLPTLIISIHPHSFIHPASTPLMIFQGGHFGSGGRIRGGREVRHVSGGSYE